MSGSAVCSHCCVSRCAAATSGLCHFNGIPDCFDSRCVLLSSPPSGLKYKLACGSIVFKFHSQFTEFYEPALQDDVHVVQLLATPKGVDVEHFKANTGSCIALRHCIMHACCVFQCLSAHVWMNGWHGGCLWGCLRVSPSVACSMQAGC